MPHSDIYGSMDICSSPWLFAACHVFHRRSVPRHPPCALCHLIFRVLVHTLPAFPLAYGTHGHFFALSLLFKRVLLDEIDFTLLSMSFLLQYAVFKVQYIEPARGYYQRCSCSRLLSHTVSSIVPSAAYGLTVVFGMGTGVSHKRITTGTSCWLLAN